MGLETYSVGTCAEVAELPRGTLAVWRTRGRVPQREYTLADVMSLALAADLAKMGLTVEHATAIGWAVRDGWEDVLLASPRRTFLLARPGRDKPWIIATCSQREIPIPPVGGTLQVDLHHIATRVMARLQESDGA